MSEVQQAPTAEEREELLKKAGEMFVKALVGESLDDKIRTISRLCVKLSMLAYQQHGKGLMSFGLLSQVYIDEEANPPQVVTQIMPQHFGVARLPGKKVRKG